MTSWMIISAEMGRFATQAQLRVPAFMIFDIGKFWQKSHLTEGFAFGSFHVAEMLCRWNVIGNFHKRRSFEPKENKWAGPVPLIGSINMEQLLIMKSFYTGLLTRCFFAVLYADIDSRVGSSFFFFVCARALNFSHHLLRISCQLCWHRWLLGVWHIQSCEWFLRYFHCRLRYTLFLCFDMTCTAFRWCRFCHLLGGKPLHEVTLPVRKMSAAGNVFHSLVSVSH